jgi:hypothetical protein
MNRDALTAKGRKNLALDATVTASATRTNSHPRRNPRSQFLPLRPIQLPRPPLDPQPRPVLDIIFRYAASPEGHDHPHPPTQ